MKWKLQEEAVQCDGFEAKGRGFESWFTTYCLVTLAII